MILLVVDRDLVPLLHDALKRYEDDLRRDGGQRVPVGLHDLRVALARRFRDGHGGPISSAVVDLPDNPTVTPLLLSYGRAATVLDVSVTTIKRLVADGDLVAFRVKGAPRIRVEDLEDYVFRLDAKAEAS